MLRVMLLAAGLSLAVTAQGASLGQGGKPTPSPMPKAWTSAEVDKWLGSVGKKSLAAKKPDELDGLRQQVKELLGETQRKRELAIYREDLQGLDFFLEHWQKYLGEWAAGRRDEAFEELRTTLDDNRWVGWVPRSEVLGRWNAWKGYYHVSYQRDSIEDLAKAVAAIKQLEVDSGVKLKMDTPVEEFQGLEDLWEGRARGNWDEIVQGCTRPAQSVDIMRFQQLLLPYAIAGYLKLDKRYDLAPKKGGMASDQLVRIIDLADKNGDLVTLWRALTFRDSLMKMPPWIEQATSAVDACLMGQKLEGEGRTAEAVRAYLEVLRRYAWQGVLEKASARLAEIQKTNPTEYEEGTHRVVYPGPTMRGAMDPRERYEQMRERNRYGQMPPGMDPYGQREQRQAWKKY